MTKNYLSANLVKSTRTYFKNDSRENLCIAPFAKHNDTKVIDSRLISEGASVRRRRECPICNERFSTFEVAELIMPRIIKRDGRRSPFDEEKLRAGMRKALGKRPVSMEQTETAINHILHRLRKR